MTDLAFYITREIDEPLEEWAIRLQVALEGCRDALLESERNAGLALDRWTLAAGAVAASVRARELAQATEPSAQTESPFIRQNNAIRKYVENQLAGEPGRDKLLIRFLAGILDIELRDQWVADRD